MKKVRFTLTRHSRVQHFRIALQHSKKIFRKQTFEDKKSEKFISAEITQIRISRKRT